MDQLDASKEAQEVIFNRKIKKKNIDPSSVFNNSTVSNEQFTKAGRTYIRLPINL